MFQLLKKSNKIHKIQLSARQFQKHQKYVVLVKTILTKIIVIITTTTTTTTT